MADKMKVLVLRVLIFLIWLLIFSLASYMISREIRNKNFSQLIKIWIISSVFVLTAIPISLYGILQHLLHYTKPYLQIYIIRILWMVPIYTINAWVALRFPKSAIYLDTLRECYEAYVIYNFMTFLLNYLKSNLDLVATLEEKRIVTHLFPANLFLPKWKPGWPFIQNCKRGALQYTVIRPLMTIVALVTEMLGVYKDGTFSFRYAWIYTVIINNLSQLFAMYCLILFYKATHEELKPMKPLGKFFCVKAVVFASFWQSVLIAFLVHTKILTEGNTWKIYDAQTLQASLQDFCICVEMLFASIAHYYCFSAQPYHVESVAGGADRPLAPSPDGPEGSCSQVAYATARGDDECMLGENVCGGVSIRPPNRGFLGTLFHSVFLMLNVSDVYDDMHQQVNYMIKSNHMKNKYRDQMKQNTNIMAIASRNRPGEDFEEDSKLLLDCTEYTNNFGPESDTANHVQKISTSKGLTFIHT